MNKYLTYKREKLYFNNKSIEEIIKTKGTPLKIFSPSLAKKQVLWLKERLMENIKVGYAFKANPSFDILREIRDDIDFVTLMDYNHSAHIRKIFNKDMLIVNILSKVTNEMRKYKKIVWVAHNLKQYNELKKKDVRIMIRYNPRIKSKSMFSTYNQPFGLLKKDIEKIKDEEIEGIHAHFASQAKNVREWERYLNDLSKVVEKLKVKKVNIGGGIPYPYTPNVKVDRVIEEINRFGSKLKDVEVMIEPGTFIAAPTKIAVLRIVKTMKYGGDKAAIANASVYNTHPDILIRKEKNKILPLIKLNISKMKTLIRGNTMDSLDVFSSHFPYEIEENDVVIVADIGAYNYHTTFFDLHKLKEIKI